MQAQFAQNQELDRLIYNFDTARDTFPRHIFIVEDDPSTKLIFEKIFKTIDPKIQVDWATNAEEALHEIRKNKAQYGIQYDLIVADVFLEGKATGIHLWQICQQDSPSTPLLLTSSMELESFFRAIGQNTICPPFLPKPFSIGECKQMLLGLLEYGRKTQWNV